MLVGERRQEKEHMFTRRFSKSRVELRMVVETRAGGGVSARGALDGQLEGDVHLGFLCQRHDFRKLYNL